jgi:hypothetical protein
MGWHLLSSRSLFSKYFEFIIHLPLHPFTLWSVRKPIAP